MVLWLMAVSGSTNKRMGHQQAPNNNKGNLKNMVSHNHNYVFLEPG